MKIDEKDVLRVKGRVKLKRSGLGEDEPYGAEEKISHDARGAESKNRRGFVCPREGLFPGVEHQ